jgi:uncharacterized protein YbjT (DUF2867 family)
LASVIGQGFALAARALLTGATGFIGAHLYAPLRAAGFQVRCLTRQVPPARARWPERDWIAGDAQDEASLTAALEGCQVAYYLVHGMSAVAPGWVERELGAAKAFAAAAERARVERIVYLGGVAPQGEASAHLRSRLETGELLRAGKVPCVELRAAMIVGSGSASWSIVRDLAARLPAMVLPGWLSHRSQPVALDDVIAALSHAGSAALSPGETWDLPGPEALSGVEILLRIAALLGRRPLMVRVPFVSPRLSSHWIRLVTRVDYRLAAELVEGLTGDLLARNAAFWSQSGLPAPRAFDDAARAALAEDARQLSPAARQLERFAKLLTPRS